MRATLQPAFDIATTPKVTVSFATWRVDARWTNPPTVTHNTWVRILPAAYSGVWSDAYRDVLRGWLHSTDIDVLGHAMSYIANAAAGYQRASTPDRDNPAIPKTPSRRWTGNAKYGPLDAAAARVEGSDYADYIAETIQYPSFSNPGSFTADPPEVDQVVCVDCSGLVRTVFGMRGGIAMQLAPAWPDGRIPRDSNNQNVNGIGIFVFTGATRPTSGSIAKLAPGDVVFFDATADPGEEEGQIDHDGIVLGADATTGRIRFVSSRKTAQRAAVLRRRRSPDADIDRHQPVLGRPPSSPTLLKIAVYTIAKDAAGSIADWADSALDADIRVVVDTGSSDATFLLAQGHGCDVHRISVDPWRFDDARNASLALVPADVDLCVALDCDEVLLPGWRDHLERLDPGVTRPRYKYTWSWKPDGTPGLIYIGDKIHARTGYRWKHPVHEVITPTAAEVSAFCGLEIHHHPNGAPRDYLGLLELSVSEDPHDDRNAHYYARELWFQDRNAQAAAEFKRHLALPTAVWPPERAKSMRLLAHVEPDHAESWLLRACAEDPSQRESWLDLAAYYYRTGQWQQSLAAAERCLAITERTGDYLSEPEAWGPAPTTMRRSPRTGSAWMPWRSTTAGGRSSLTRVTNASAPTSPNTRRGRNDPEAPVPHRP